MRILLTSYMDPLAPCGVRAYYQLLQAGLEAEGHEVRVITPSSASFPFRLLTGGFRRVAGCGGTYRNLIAHELKCWGRIFAATRVLHWRPDIVHAQDVGSGTAAAEALRHRCPVMVTAHFNEDPVQEILDRHALPGHPARWFRRRFSRQFSEILYYVVPSHHAAESLRRWVPSDSHVTVVPNACDFKFIGAAKPADDLRALAKTRKIILSAGTLEPRKDPWFLLELAAVLASRDDMVLLHAGDGPLKGKMEAAIAARKLTNIRLLGQRADLASVMKSARLFIHFPLRETFGLVVIEAIAAGVPVLARKVGGIPDILDGLEDTSLYEAQAPASAVGRDILSLMADSGRLDRLTEEQYRVGLQRFDKTVFIRAMETTYRLLTDSVSAPL